MKLLRYILFPVVPFYYIVTWLRNKLYDLGWKSSKSYDTAVICVGNLSTGGTGKTPTIEYLIRLLSGKYKIATLSRGYKRETQGFIIANEFATAKSIGDEPFQFYNKFKDIVVGVDANRQNGISQLIKIKQPDVILLDDAFQHRKVKAGYYILLTKYNDLYSDDFLLPTGNLRESRRGAKRANSIVVTKCPEDLSKEAQQKIKQQLKLSPDQKLFFSTINYNENIKGKKESLTINDLKEKEVVLVTGIANPKPLLEYLKKERIQFTHLKYADHYHFSNEDITKIKTVFDQLSSNNKIILTTEKDYMRLENKLDNLFYLEIVNTFLNSNSCFNIEIQNFIKK